MFIEMQLEDIDQVLEIEKRCFNHPWQKKDFVFELTENPFAYYKVIKKDQQIIGYIGYWIRDQYVEITNVAVDLPYQRQGYGLSLLEQCQKDSLLQKATIFTLEVRKSNSKAIHLYEKFGFVKQAVRKNYYTDTNEDAYLMMKEVK